MVGGAPIGTDQYQDEVATAIFAGVHRRLEALATLKEHGEDQMARTLLKLCVMSSVTHLIRTTAPRITTPYAERFDIAMDGVRETLIGEVAGTCGPERIGRMHALAALPVKEGGLGHARISPLAPLAFLAGLAAASELAQLAEKREVLKTEVIWAHARATEVLGGGEDVNRARLASPEFAEAFPADPEELYKNKRVLSPLPTITILKTHRRDGNRCSSRSWTSKELSNSPASSTRSRRTTDQGVPSPPVTRPAWVLMWTTRASSGRTGFSGWTCTARRFG
jgi:hypothetical protein